MGGDDAVVVIDDTALPKPGRNSVGLAHSTYAVRSDGSLRLQKGVRQPRKLSLYVAPTGILSCTP